MLVLYEMPSGYALFKLQDKSLVKASGDLHSHFATPEAAATALKLKAFGRFKDTTAALAGAAAICDGTLDPFLAEFLRTNLKEKGKLAVADVKLGAAIKEQLGLKCVYSDSVLQIMRGIRLQIASLIEGIPESDRQAMKLGLAHSLCRYKLKFSPDKVDTMIVQAIALLDELDKELNTYSMRLVEWHGWHYPEMAKIIGHDNIMYAKIVHAAGRRADIRNADLSDVMPEELEKELKDGAEVSMGTDVSEADVTNIQALAYQVISIHEYRASLFEYLKNRMQAIAPNLTFMVGELVGARLIAHAGSLLNLAKQPASTVQILGAEKALFRALKTKSETPKYGLIYHASLVGQAAPKLKGKISRVLAAKTALSVRMDALGHESGVTIALEGREKVENRLRVLEGGHVQSQSGRGSSKAHKQHSAYSKPAAIQAYNEDADVVMGGTTPEKPSKGIKRKRDSSDDAAAADSDADAAKAAKKHKKEKKAKKKKDKKKKDKKKKKSKD